MQNFVSAATGMAVAVVAARGFAARATGNLGFFWVDLTHSILDVLLPLALVLALLLAWQGVPQSLHDYTVARTLEGAEQLIAQGPAASQVAIKQLGTNGGGFFSVNSAHPLENPTLVSNMLQALAILLIPIAFPFLYGRLVGEMRQGGAIFAAMGVLFLLGLAVVYGRGPPRLVQPLPHRRGRLPTKSRPAERHPSLHTPVTLDPGPYRGAASPQFLPHRALKRVRGREGQALQIIH